MSDEKRKTLEEFVTQDLGMTMDEYQTEQERRYNKKPSTILGKQLAQLEIEKFELKNENNILGQQIVNLELELLSLKGGQ